MNDIVKNSLIYQKEQEKVFQFLQEIENKVKKVDQIDIIKQKEESILEDDVNQTDISTNRVRFYENRVKLIN